MGIVWEIWAELVTVLTRSNEVNPLPKARTALKGFVAFCLLVELLIARGTNVS